MALNAPVTARVPRRYMIQNLTGATIHYWAGVSTYHARKDAGSKAAGLRHCVLRNGANERLRVEPATQVRCKCVRCHEEEDKKEDGNDDGVL